MSEIVTGDMGPWLSPEDLSFVRRKVPLLYVDVVPVRLDGAGIVQSVGLLLRTPREGGIQRALVSGRVLYQETLREALARHIEKDLGPMAIPRLPASLAPFTVAEYFPTPSSAYHDPRQHAVSLAYIIPVDGDCAPQQDALDLAWLTPAEAVDPMVQAEMVSGHASLVLSALAFVGRLP